MTAKPRQIRPGMLPFGPCRDVGPGKRRTTERADCSHDGSPGTVTSGEMDGERWQYEVFIKPDGPPNISPDQGERDLARGLPHSPTFLGEKRRERPRSMGRGQGLGLVANTNTSNINAMDAWFGGHSIRRPANSSIKARGWGSLFGSRARTDGGRKNDVARCWWS